MVVPVSLIITPELRARIGRARAGARLTGIVGVIGSDAVTFTTPEATSTITELTRALEMAEDRRDGRAAEKIQTETKRRMDQLNQEADALRGRLHDIENERRALLNLSARAAGLIKAIRAALMRALGEAGSKRDRDQGAGSKRDRDQGAGSEQM